MYTLSLSKSKKNLFGNQVAPSFNVPSSCQECSWGISIETFFKQEEKKMLKKFGYSLVVAGALMLGVGVVNTVLVGSAMAAEEEKCDKCGHLPSKPEKDCKCECHHAKH